MMSVVHYIIFALATVVAVVDGSTQLTTNTNAVTINTEDGFAMPTSITIEYSSDTGSTAYATSTTDEVWISWSMTTGDTWYTGSPPGSLTVDGNTEFTIDLTRDTGSNPTAGNTEDIVLDIALWYNNDGLEFELDNVVYEFEVDVNTTSTIVSATRQTTSTTSITVGSIADDVTGTASISIPPANLEINQKGNSVDQGEDIVLEITTTTSGYTLWVKETDLIIASDDTTFGDGDDYEWPIEAVDSDTTSESGVTDKVTLTLSSCPAEIFDYGTLYFRVTVHYRDTNGDRRRLLRGLLGKGPSRQLQQWSMLDDNKDETQVEPTRENNVPSLVSVIDYNNGRRSENTNEGTIELIGIVHTNRSSQNRYKDYDYHDHTSSNSGSSSSSLSSSSGSKKTSTVGIEKIGYVTVLLIAALFI